MALQISYGQAAGVRVPTRTAGVESRAMAEVADVLSQGFAEMGQEVIRREQTEADLRVSEKLAELDVQLAGKKEFTAQEVRAAFGDNVPSSVEQHLTLPGADGTLVDNDRVAAWKVAGAVYEAQAKRALAEAESGITTGPGWKKAFRDRTAEVVHKKKTEFAAGMMKQFVDGSRTATLNQVDRYKNLGMFDMATAAVQSASFFDKAEKEKLLFGIRNDQQTAPVYKAMQSNDLGELNKQLTLLKGSVNEKGERNPETDKFDTIDEKQRGSLVNALESQIRSIEHEQKTAAKKQENAVNDEMWRAVNAAAHGAKLPGGKRLNSSAYGILTPFMKTADAEEVKQAMLFLEGQIKGEERKTDDLLYYRIGQSMAAHPEKFKDGLINVAEPGQPPKFKSYEQIMYRLAPSDAQTWADRITSARTNREPRDPSVISPHGVADNEMQHYGFDPKDKDNAVVAGWVYRAVDVAVAAERRAKGGGPLTPEEENTVASNTVKQLARKEEGGFLRKDKVTFGGENPEVEITLRNLAARRGEQLTPGGMKLRMNGYLANEPVILDHWRSRKSGQVLDTATAATIHDRIISDHASLRGMIRGFDEMDLDAQQRALAILATELHIRGQ